MASTSKPLYSTLSVPHFILGQEAEGTNNLFIMHQSFAATAPPPSTYTPMGKGGGYDISAFSVLLYVPPQGTTGGQNFALQIPAFRNSKSPLLAGVSGGFSPGTPVFAPPTD